jgi:hypothetical protein
MSEKNNIENLFRNKFKDFEIAPPEQVWINIEKKLSENKKQKPKIPFWLRVSGAAAILLLGITIARYYSNINNSENSIVNSQKKVNKNSDGSPLISKEKLENPKSIVVENSNKNENSNLVSNKNSIINQNSNQNEISNNISKSENNNSVSRNVNKNSKIEENKIANNASKSENNNSVSEKVNQNSKIEENKIANNVSKSDNENSVSGKVNKNSKIEENKIANNAFKSDNENSVSGKVNQNSRVTNKSISKIKTTSFSNQNSLVFKNSKSKNENLDSKKSKLFNSSSKKNSNAFAQNDKKNFNYEKNSENDEKFTNSEKENNYSKSNNTDNQTNIISKSNNSGSKIVATEIKKDTAKIVSNLPNPLEELLTKKDKKSSDKVAKVNRWQVFPNVAPIYFGSASNGSPIDDIFTKNSKNYKPNLSYGLAVNYSVNKRFSVQTGVNKVTLDYNTNDIVFYADLKATNIKTINTKNEAAKMRVENKQANSDESIATVVNQGYLNQKIGYIEIPVEVNYKLIDKKFGINLNAGISTLVLNENIVSVVSDTNFKMVLGEANNLNKFHVSSNVGVGFNYKFMKSFQINVEPKLKYQINTFNSNDGNFKPYFIGIYSGISYHF